MSYYKSKQFYERDYIDRLENFHLPQPTVRTVKVKKQKENKQKKENNQPTKKEINQPTKKKYISTDPSSWGAGFWKVLHLGAGNYPNNPSPIAIQKMSFFIKGLPYILPCENCFHHALDYIEENKNNLDEICKNRDNLFKFFHKFHNSVNKRLGKPACKFNDAKNKFCN